MKKTKTFMKKLLSTGLVVGLLLFSGPTAAALASVPTPPPAPTAELAPTNDEEAPTPAPAPTAEPAPTNDAEAPTSAPAPTAEPAPTNDAEAPTAPPAPTPSPSSDPVSQDSAEAGEPSPGPSSSEGATASDSSDSSYDGQVGDPAIDTGDASSTAVIVNDVNNNLSAILAGDGSGGVSVVNSENGTESDNDGSATLITDNDTTQDNSVVIVNNLTQSSESGENSASRNVGDSSVDTGNANTTGTIINAVNTNVDGVAVSEFNIVDDHVGDIVLDFGANCLVGCGGGDILAENSGNGSDSTNSSDVDTITNNNTFQENDATLENNMVLASDSGNNNTDKNTGGDSSIDTGNASVAANVLNFANNNLAGNVVYAVVNIFGDLVGDIIYPEGQCCFGSVTAKNSGNGSGSDNDATIDSELNNETFQFNDATIENNIVLDANTGKNTTSGNTGGASSIETGNADVEVQVINIANNNIDGGDMWLVIVNEAGKWLGRIVGAPEGSYLAGSDGFEFVVGADGEITVVNAGNGSNSTNAASANTVVNNTTTQKNTANIVNNLDLSANTGGNSASSNTGGDSSIETGNAEIIANIVNFVNNNITGSGNLFVTVVNVFGSWIGDFVGPGYEKTVVVAEADGDEQPAAIGGAVDVGSSNTGGSSNPPADDGGGSGEPTVAVSGVVAYAVQSFTGVFSGGVGNGTDESGDGSLAGSYSENVGGNKTITLNLAMLLPLLPAAAVMAAVRRKRANEI